jgi:hypothetical protein
MRQARHVSPYRSRAMFYSRSEQISELRVPIGCFASYFHMSALRSDCRRLHDCHLSLFEQGSSTGTGWVSGPEDGQSGCRAASGARAWRPCAPGRLATGYTGCCGQSYCREVQQRRLTQPDRPVRRHTVEQQRRAPTTVLRLTRNEVIRPRSH